ncbi:MAG: TRAP transporter permease [Campylobacterales bacterium]
MSKELSVEFTEEKIEEIEGQRDFGKQHWQYWTIALIAFSWSIFQLYIAYTPTNSTIARSIHLGFAMALTFLIYPPLKAYFRSISLFYLDILIGAVATLAALYLFIDFQGLAHRPGAYITRDVIVAVVGTILLLEASRRVIGPALAIVAIVFIAYDYFGPYMPDMIAHRGASIEKLSGQLYLTTNGIFGVPLGVSTSFVFLFVLFGAMLERAGAGEYFIRLSYAFLGRYRGGPAKASVVASGLTGMISGSSTANVVTTGTFTIPLMKKVGMPAEKAAAVEVAASTNGQLMPPIMGAAAFIMAEYLGIGYVDVIYAAFIPAFASYFALLYIVHLESCKLGIRGEDPSQLPPRFKTLLTGMHYIIPVFFLLYTLIVLQESVVSAAFNAIMLLMLLMVLQHPFKRLIEKKRVRKEDVLQGFSDIFFGMVNGAKSMVPIALATAVAGIVVGSITLTGVGQVLIEVIETISGNNIFLILLFTAITSLILGMGLPTTANYIVMASLTAPVIMQLSLDNGYLLPAIAAHLFVFYFGILADDTPPVGIAAYAGSGIAKSNPITTGLQGFAYDMRTAVLPFIFFFNPTLLLISGVDSSDPTNPASWIWIDSPLEIVIIFATATLGLFAFASFVQRHIVTRSSIFEQVMLIPIFFLFMLPRESANFVGLYESHYISYAIALGLTLFIYMKQKRRLCEKEGCL